jgi:hypothetical protein
MLCIAMMLALTCARAFVPVGPSATPVTLLGEVVVHLNLYASVPDGDGLSNIGQMCAGNRPVSSPTWLTFGGRYPGRPYGSAGSTFEHAFVGGLVALRRPKAMYLNASCKGTNDFCGHAKSLSSRRYEHLRSPAEPAKVAVMTHELGQDGGIGCRAKGSGHSLGRHLSRGEPEPG